MSFSPRPDVDAPPQVSLLAMRACSLYLCGRMRQRYAAAFLPELPIVAGRRTAPMDRRQHERYTLETPVNFSWNDPGDVRQRRKGFLSNISGGGILVSTHGPPPNGACIHFTVCLRPLYGGARLVIRAVGQVLRVESASETEGPTQFAASIKTFTLHENHEELIGRLNSRKTRE